ncbi:MAG: MATE family efflux transporter [Fervidicoccaceae archaeon]
MEKGENRELLENRTRILYGSPLNTLLWLSWPAIVANYVNMAYNLINALWLGRLGVEQFDAPTITSTVIWLFQSIGMAYSTAGSTIISQYFGGGDLQRASKSSGFSITFLFILSLFVSIPVYMATPWIISVMNTPSDVYPFAVSYMKLSILGTPLVFLSFSLTSIMNSYGDTRTPTKINIASIILNMILDPILIFGLFGFPRLEVKGAAITSNIARGFQASLLLLFLFREKGGMKPSKDDLFPNSYIFKLINKVGFPLVIQNITINLAFLIMMSIVAHFGDAAVAAYGVTLRLLDIVQSFTWGINRGLSIMIAQAIGAEIYERAKKVASIAHRFVFLSLLIGATLISIFRIPLIRAFINDDAVASVGSSLMIAFAASLPFLGLFFTSSALATGSGHTLNFTILSIIRLYVFRIGLSGLLGFLFGLGQLGVWIAISLSNLYAGIGGYLWAKKGEWLSKAVR